MISKLVQPTIKQQGFSKTFVVCLLVLGPDVEHQDADHLDADHLDADHLMDWSLLLISNNPRLHLGNLHLSHQNYWTEPNCLAGPKVQIVKVVEVMEVMGVDADGDRSDESPF